MSPGCAEVRARPRGLLLDFGGTLDADGVHCRGQFLAAYHQEGLLVSPQEFEQAFAAAERHIAGHEDLSRASLTEMLRVQVREQLRALGQPRHPASPAIVSRVYRAAAANLARNAPILERLRTQGLVLGLVSNFPGNLDRVCREFCLQECFLCLLDSTREGLFKPDPRLYLLALERLGLPPSRAWMVGDSLDKDLQPCHRLGMFTVWLTPPGSTPAPAWVDARVAGLQELEGLIPGG